MDGYVATFNADIDIKIEADSPEEALEIAKKKIGEHYDALFDYAYISNIKLLTYADGTEVIW